MTDVGITAFGAYLPRLRLQRKAMAQANAWFNPGIMGQGKGERTMASSTSWRTFSGRVDMQAPVVAWRAA